MDPIDEQVRWQREMEKRAEVMASEHLWILLFIVCRLPGRSFEFYCQVYNKIEKETLEKHFRQLQGYGYVNIKNKELNIEVTESGKEFVKAVVSRTLST